MKRCLSLLAAVGCLVAPSDAADADVVVSLADDAGVLDGVASDTALVVRTDDEAYRSSVPLGEWYDVASVTVDKNGAQTRLDRRTMRMDATTYRGRLNLLLSRLKDENPDREIYLVTPAADTQAIATNGVGALLGDYAAAVREAGNVWSVTVVDLAGALPVSATEEMEFFRSSPSATNRPPASVGRATVGCALDSRREQSAVSLGVPFFPEGVDGFSLKVM